MAYIQPMPVQVIDCAACGQTHTIDFTKRQGELTVHPEYPWQGFCYFGHKTVYMRLPIPEQVIPEPQPFHVE